ncbi:MAG: hypothetical protein DRR19_05655 [Candidatus Parabeggiatoa sp. nov. 1]|nr:MAG: hypothetical protein DRR19_05655 [Gammaproteobacteria bacterium]
MMNEKHIGHLLFFYTFEMMESKWDQVLIPMELHFHHSTTNPSIFSRLIDKLMSKRIRILSLAGIVSVKSVLLSKRILFF